MSEDIGVNPSANELFEDIAEAFLSRRKFVGLALATGAAALVPGAGSLVNTIPASAQTAERYGSLLGFKAIPTSELDRVVVPEGYTAKVLISWGDPVSNGPAFKPDASNSAADQSLQWGMNNDGLVYFPIDGSRHGLIVQNNEYTDDVLLFPDGMANWNAEKTAKSQNAHGVSIIEIKQNANGKDWSVVRPSRFARRITGQTPMKISGPAAGHASLKTSSDPTGTKVLGTINNCAMGVTPWGTYLACEENFNGYFRKTGDRTESETRYGITSVPGYLWHTTDKRFDANAEPNEANRFGWVVEIDPFAPKAIPVKHTSLGRFKHEGAKVQEARDGRVVVYSGDDEQFEYIYRYVSRLPWRQSRQRGIDPLEDGTLYVAKFTADGKGQWLELSPSNPALKDWTLAEILINTRKAADLAGATKMDRPEWIDTFSDSLTGIVTLTNNSRRGRESDPATDAANPRATNTYGHIVRWFHRKDWTEDTFEWDFFALCGDPENPAHGSTIKGDKYGSPDGIYVAPSGRLWIQTDVSGGSINPENRADSYKGFGNNQMLCADPVTRETRRFLTGPNVCEVTGVMVTPDEKTMFVGIQHPGESPGSRNDAAAPKRYSSWPEGEAGGRPRSALVVITKDDGGVIGS